MQNKFKVVEILFYFAENIDLKPKNLIFGFKYGILVEN